MIMHISPMPAQSAFANRNTMIMRTRSFGNLGEYVRNNRLTAFVLFTIFNECCRHIMLYHSTFNSCISNTQVSNFILYDYHLPVLNTTEDHTNALNRSSVLKDYDTFSESLRYELAHKNSHLELIHKLSYTTAMKKINNI